MKKILLLVILCFSFTSPYEDDFDLLMGKSTKHWDHVKTREDFEVLKRLKALYDKNKRFRFTQSRETKIPKVVHFIWLGPRPFPLESVENIRTWIAKNPNWKIKFWTDRDRPIPCTGMEKIVIRDYPFPYLGRCYESSENWGEKSDILRFEILYKEGGVYVDHDANCLQSFDGLHAGYDFYCGLEAPHPPFVGFNITAGIGVVGSRSGHPICKKVIDLIASRWDDIGRKYPGKDGFSRTQIVIERTYIALTEALKEKLDLDGNVDIVLPAACFFAKAGIPALYSKHFFGNTWADDTKKNFTFEKQTKKELSGVEQKLNRIYLISAVIFAFHLLLICFGVALFKKTRISR